ncbi:hypothetical protein Tco_1035307 [Tanacetum coccineum]
MTTAWKRAIVNTGKDSGSFMVKKVEYVDPKGISKSDHAVVDNGCSSHMTGNKAYLSDYEDYNRGFVAFGSDPKGENQVNVDVVVAKALDVVQDKLLKRKKEYCISKDGCSGLPVLTKIQYCTPTGANAGESSFVYLGGKIPIDASTLPNADLPIDPNMPNLEDDSDAFSNDGIFNGAYDDENVGISKDQNLGDPKSACSNKRKDSKGFLRTIRHWKNPDIYKSIKDDQAGFKAIARGMDAVQIKAFGTKVGLQE